MSGSANNYDADKLISDIQAAHQWGISELVQNFPMLLKAALDTEAWKGRFGSFYELATAEVPDGLGLLEAENPLQPRAMTYTKAIDYCEVMHKEIASRVREAQPALATHGTNRHSRGDNITSRRRGTDPNYLTRRLKRDHPDIFDHLGDFSSVRAAAIAAGIVKVPTQLVILKKAWGKASDEERSTFLAQLDIHHTG